MLARKGSRILPPASRSRYKSFGMIDLLLPFSEPVQRYRPKEIRAEIGPIYERFGIVLLANVAVEESAEN